MHAPTNNKDTHLCLTRMLENEKEYHAYMLAQ